MSVHSLFSPSGASRWLACPGSVYLDNPERVEKTNDLAARGTLIHSIFEECVNTKREVKYAETFNGEPTKSEQYEIANEAFNYLKPLIFGEYQIFAELKVKVGQVKKCYGTVDFAAYSINDNKHYIYDLKTGYTQVNAEGNPQLMLYALGFIKEWKIKLKVNDTITLGILQPTIHNYDEYVITYKELLEFVKVAKLAITEALKPYPKRSTGPHCKYCPNSPTCVTQSNEIRSMLANLTIPEKITNDELEELYSKSEFVINYFDDINKKILIDLLAGKTFKKYKLVESNKHRAYNDLAEPKLVELLGDIKAYNKKPISITEAKKLISAKVLESITFKPRGEPVVAPMNDKRKNYMDYDKEFAELSANIVSEADTNNKNVGKLGEHYE